MKRLVALGLIAGTLGGCLGKPGPVEEYLKVSSGGDCGGVVSPSKAATVVAIRPIKSADALDRQAVMLARGRVLNPSLRWYWEATPAKMAEQAMAGALNCTPTLVSAWPTRSTTEAAYTLTGTVSAFEVQEQNLVMNVSVNCQIWDGKNANLVGSREFTNKQQIIRMDAQSIAEAGANALSGVSTEVGAWVRSVAIETSQLRNKQ